MINCRLGGELQDLAFLANEDRKVEARQVNSIFRLQIPPQKNGLGPILSLTGSTPAGGCAIVTNDGAPYIGGLRPPHRLAGDQDQN